MHVLTDALFELCTRAFSVEIFRDGFRGISYLATTSTEGMLPVDRASCWKLGLFLKKNFCIQTYSGQMHTEVESVVRND